MEKASAARMMRTSLWNVRVTGRRHVVCPEATWRKDDVDVEEEVEEEEEEEVDCGRKGEESIVDVVAFFIACVRTKSMILVVRP